eukprot:m.124835 g.124835  ORF g.124835 m.124835 type:complete len:258 (-) comp19760_c0_seq1:143-916(-)
MDKSHDKEFHSIVSQLRAMRAEVQQEAHSLAAAAKNERAPCKSASLKQHFTHAIEKTQQEINLYGALSRAVQYAIKQADSVDAATLQRIKRQSSVINSIDSYLPTWPDLKDVRAGCGAHDLDRVPLVPGQEVAAATTDPQTQTDSWILATVVRAQADRVLVQDIFEEEGKAERYILKRNKVRALPLWAPARGFPQQHLAVGQLVLGLYPQTTCFYPGAVHEIPSKDQPQYVIRFDDDEYEDGRVRYQAVPVKYVIAA